MVRSMADNIEAQKDRFLMHVEIGYVDMESELKALKLLQEECSLPQALAFEAQKEVAKVKKTINRARA